MNNVANAPKKFNKFTLGVSILIFLSVCPYWFISTNSQLSIINILIGKYSSSYSPQPWERGLYQVGTWPVFYAHVITTCIGLAIYYKSNFTRWLGEIISYQYIADFFYKKNKKATVMINCFKIIIALSLIYCLYEILIEMIKGNSIPAGTFSIGILLFFIGTAGWNIAYPQNPVMPELQGSLDNRNKTMLIRLSDNQIAYVQNRNNKIIWDFSPCNSDVNLSFTETYIFKLSDLSHHIPDVELLNSSIGNIHFYFEMVGPKIPTLDIFPKTTSYETVLNLNTLTKKENLTDIIYLAINQNDIKDEVKKKYDLLNTYFVSNPRASTQEWNDKFKNIYEEINAIKLDLSIQNEIKYEIDKFIGKDIFKITCSITQDTAKEYFEEKIRAHHQETARKEQDITFKIEEEERNAMQREKEIVLTAISKRLETPGLPFKAAKEWMELIKEIRTTPTKANIEQAKDMLRLSEGNEKITIDQNLVNASKEIASAIITSKRQNYNENEARELISSSTIFLAENKISFDTFYKKLTEKWNTEREERTEEAYQMIARDTLLSLLES